MMNATGIAVGRDGLIYISSRFDGVVYQVTPGGSMSVFVEGMGVATGICFDKENNLYVGDRSGTVFKISPNRQIFVFATIEPSISAYHLAWGPDQHLYVSGPTTSSFDAIYRVTDNGDVETFYRGLGRPQGMAFDADGNLYSASSWQGRKGVVRITPDRNARSLCFRPRHRRPRVFSFARHDRLHHQRDLPCGCRRPRCAVPVAPAVLPPVLLNEI